jgi:hypothetical protein
MDAAFGGVRKEVRKPQLGQTGKYAAAAEREGVSFME